MRAEDVGSPARPGARYTGAGFSSASGAIACSPGTVRCAVISGGRNAPDFWWNLFTAIVYILAGLAVLTRPMTGILTLTIVLAAYLLAGGIMRIFLSVHYRARIPKAWVWVLISGIVDIVLSGIIMMGLPGTAVWVLGLLVGINLLMMGISLVMVAMHERRSLAHPDTHAGAKAA